jgi:hypothetical protein
MWTRGGNGLWPCDRGRSDPLTAIRPSSVSLLALQAVVPLKRGEWGAKVSGLRAWSARGQSYRRTRASVSLVAHMVGASIHLSSQLTQQTKPGPTRQGAVLWWRRLSPEVGTRTSSRRDTEICIRPASITALHALLGRVSEPLADWDYQRSR